MIAYRLSLDDGKSSNSQKARPSWRRFVLNQLTAMSESRYVSPYEIAVIHSGLGQKEQCFEWLNRAYEIRDGWMIYITVDPRWQSLRGDVRFRRIVQSVGLAPAGGDLITSYSFL